MFFVYIHWLCVLCIYIGYVFCVYTLAMCFVYIHWVCVLCIYIGYVFCVYTLAMCFVYIHWLCVLCIPGVNMSEAMIVCYLFTLGEVVQLCPGHIPNRVLLLVQSMIAAPCITSLPASQSANHSNSSGK